jgi:hypothetical protein
MLCGGELLSAKSPPMILVIRNPSRAKQTTPRTPNFKTGLGLRTLSLSNRGKGAPGLLLRHPPRDSIYLENTHQPGAPGASFR